MDVFNIYGRMKDIRISSYGQSELDDYVIAYAEEVGRIVLPDPTPEKGQAYSSCKDLQENQCSIGKVFYHSNPVALRPA